MPLFRRGNDLVEAYRLPQAGKEPTDGLVFFLTANGHPEHLIPPLCAKYAGCWMILTSKGHLAPYGHEKFLEDFEQV